MEPNLTWLSYGGTFGIYLCSTEKMSHSYMENELRLQVVQEMDKPLHSADTQNTSVFKLSHYFPRFLYILWVVIAGFLYHQP